MDKNQNYKQRYIAFIDILGFRDAVKKAETDEILLEDIINALKNLTLIKSFFEEKYTIIEDDRFSAITALWFKPNIQVFSDSIYISTPDLNDLGAYCALIYNVLFSYGFFSRGGVTKGNSFESENIVFGQGLIEAYDLESKSAQYPRILISDKLVTEIQATEGFHIERDFDGSYYIDVFFPGTIKMLEDWKKKSAQTLDLSKGRERLVTEYNINSSQSCRSKLYWLIQYFNSKTDNLELEKIPT